MLSIYLGRLSAGYGAVCRLGREHSIPTPCNDLLLQLVLAKQSIYLGR